MAFSPVTQPIEPMDEGTPQQETLRILVAEDDPFTLKILHKRLTAGGYTVATACNGLEGLQQVKAFKPQLILSDWMMPDMDGLEFCAQVKKHFSESPIHFILLTAKDKDEDKVSALDTGADEYLVKPCDSRELMARIRAAERTLRLQQELSRSNAQLQQALRRIHEELKATSDIQRRMLPDVLPEVPGYGFTAHYQPSSECSGDFYDVIVLDEGRLGLVIGDVSGHGTPAMVTMTLTRMLLHLEAGQLSDPAQLLFNLNNKLCTYLPTDQYVTMFYGVLQVETGQLTYSSAGQNPPLLVNNEDGQSRYLPGCEGFPLKLFGPEMTYENRSIQIGPAQQLLLYTDGLLEAMNEEMEQFDYTGITDSVKRAVGQATPQPIVPALLQDLWLHLGHGGLDDDLSLLLISRK